MRAAVGSARTARTLDSRMRERAPLESQSACGQTGRRRPGPPRLLLNQNLRCSKETQGSRSKAGKTTDVQGIKLWQFATTVILFDYGEAIVATAQRSPSSQSTIISERCPAARRVGMGGLRESIDMSSRLYVR